MWDPHYGEAFAEAEQNPPGADSLLMRIGKPSTSTDKAKQTSGIVRATAVELLTRINGSNAQPLLTQSLTDVDPLRTT